MSTRHLTLRTNSDVITEFGIDQAIDQGLQRLSDKYREVMDLVDVAVMYRDADGVVFVTIVAIGTAQIPASATPKPKEQNK